MGFHTTRASNPLGLLIPASDLSSGGDTCIRVPVNLIPHIVGMLRPLTDFAVWNGTEAARALSVKQVETFIAHIEICENNEPIECPPCQTSAGWCFTGIDCEGECSMAQCGINPKMFRWGDDGDLQIRDPCGDWVSIGAPNVAIPTNDDDPIIPPGTFEVTACSKTLAYTDVLFDIVDALLDSAAVLRQPNGALNEVKSRQPTIKFSDLYLLTAYSAAMVVAVQNFDEDAEALDVQQMIRCRIVEVIGDGEAGFSESEYNAAQDATMNYLSGKFTIFTHPTAYASIHELYRWSAKAIGPNDVNKITAYAPASENDNCNCPGTDQLPTEPTANGWYLSGNRGGQQVPVPYDPNAGDVTSDWGWAFHKEVADHDIYGFIATIELNNGEVGITKRANDAMPFMGTHDHYLSGANSDAFGLTLKIAQMNASEFSELELDGLGYTRVNPLTDDGYVNENDPPVLEGQVCLMAFSIQRYLETTASVTLTEFRWLHNANSPSG